MRAGSCGIGARNTGKQLLAWATNGRPRLKQNHLIAGRVTWIMQKNLLLFAVLVAAAISAQGSPSHPLAVKALDALNSFEDGQWSYTKTTTSKEGTKIERHDAVQPEGERWRLVRINGKEPTAKELKTYRSEKAKELEQRADPNEKDENEVDRESIRLVEETPERATFTFRTKIDGRMGRSLQENIIGTLIVNKEGAWAERFELENTGDLKPIPGVRMEKFNLIMTFQRDDTSEEIVPDTIEMHLRGRAFLVKSLDQDRISRFSEFERVRQAFTEP